MTPEDFIKSTQRWAKKCDTDVIIRHLCEEMEKLRIKNSDLKRLLEAKQEEITALLSKI